MKVVDQQSIASGMAGKFRTESFSLAMAFMVADGTVEETTERFW